MSNTIKDINIKKHTYYLFDGIINKNDFDPNNNKIDENTYLLYRICDNQKRPKNLQCKFFVSYFQ